MTGEARRRPDPALAELLAEIRNTELEALGRLEAEACQPGPPPPRPSDDLGAYLRFVDGKRPRRRHRLSGVADIDPPN